MHRILSVVVHGASGTQGAVVARRLVADGHRVAGLVRNPTAGRLTDGVSPVVADLRDTPALIRAYTGVDAVVVHLPGGSPDDAALPEAVAVLTALRAAGVPRAVFNTGGAVWDRPTGVPTLDARTALAVGLPGSVPIATVIGPAAGYMENLSAPWATAQLATEGVLVQPMPGDAPMAWLALMDVADAIADALVAEAPPPRLVLQGPESLTGEDVAVSLSTHLGRPVQWRQIPFEEHAHAFARYLGEQYASNLAALYGPDARVPPPLPPPVGAVRGGTTHLNQWLGTQRWR